MPKLINLIGIVFDYLIVVARDNEALSENSKWICKCVCGTIVSVSGQNLRERRAGSCGCSKGKRIAQKVTKHGRSHDKIYGVWASMIQRCTNENDLAYEYYGGRGITVCDRWKESFENFLEDIGECPEGMTLDRTDNNQGYYKENCCWVSRKYQSRNTRTSKLNTSGRRGVSFETERNKWVAQITFEGRNLHLGRFETFEEAVKAREQAELKYWGFIITDTTPKTVKKCGVEVIKYEHQS